MKSIITGTSKGLGKELAKELLDIGHKVTGISRGESTISHKNYKHISLDLSDTSSLTSIRKIFTESDFDLVINNASILKISMIKETSWTDIIESLESNIYSAFEISKIILSKSTTNPTKPVTIVNIASLAGLDRYPKLEGLLAYSISKSALVSLTQCLYQEIENKDMISVFCIAPGLIKTEMSKKAFGPDLMHGANPKQLGKLIVQLATQWRTIMNGQVIALDTNNIVDQ